MSTNGISQQFTSIGATYPASLAQIAGGAAVPGALLADSDQLKLRYDAASNMYEVQLPQSQNWVAIQPVAGGQLQWSGGGVSLDKVGGDATGALVTWTGPNSFGAVGIGTPTPPSNIPTEGFAVYYGSLAGFSSEKSGNAPGTIGGQIHLTFQFFTGSLTGVAFPTLTLGQTYTLPTLTLTDTVHAVGSPSFSGRFSTNLPGVNSLSGSFVGLTGLDVIGNFAFPYQSPVDSQTRQAGGAFAGHWRAGCC